MLGVKAKVVLSTKSWASLYSSTGPVHTTAVSQFSRRKPLPRQTKRSAGALKLPLGRPALTLLLEKYGQHSQETLHTDVESHQDRSCHLSLENLVAVVFELHEVRVEHRVYKGEEGVHRDVLPAREGVQLRGEIRHNKEPQGCSTGRCP